MQPNTVYTLESEKLDGVLAIFDKELELFDQLVQIQQRSEPRNRAAVCIFFLVLAIIAISGSHGLILPQTALIAGAVFWVLYMGGAIVLSRDQVRALQRLRNTQRNLGLATEKFISFVGRKEARARLPVFIQFLLTLLIAGVLFYASGRTEELSRWLVDMGILVLAIGLAVFFSFLERRNVLFFQGRLESAKKLRATLSQQESQTNKTGQLSISIPEPEYKNIAHLERALVNFDRLRTIKQSSKKVGASVLAVQQSAGVLKAKSELEPSVRVRVQTRIEELSTNPRPTNSRQTPDGNWRLPVEETAWDISYALAEHPSRILIQELIQTGQSEREES